MGVTENAFSLPPEIFSATISQLREGVCILDAAQKVVLINQEALRMLGWTQEELVSKGFHNVLHPNEAVGKECQLLRALVTGEPRIHYEDHFKKQDGNLLPVCWTVSPINIQDKVTLCVITFQDLSEQKKDLAPQAIARMSTEKMVRFQRIFEANMFGMLYGNIYGHILDANDTLLNMIGYTQQELEAGEMSWQALTPPEYAALDQNAINQLKVYGTFKPYTKQYFHKIGHRVDILISGMTEEGSSENVVAFVLDITAQKQYEKALQKGEELFRNMADASAMMIWIFNPQGEPIYYNKGLLEFFGTSFEELKHSFEDLKRTGWSQYLHPDDRMRTLELIESDFKARRFHQNEVRSLRADGEYRWLLAAGRPIITPTGEFIGYVGSCIDIHDRKMAEEALARYAKRLEQSNKELEHFATIASHDLQEPLRKVMLFTDHVKSLDHSLKEEALDDIARIQRATNKMQRLINDLLDLSRITRRGKPFQRVDLNEVVEEAIAELSYAYKNIRQRVKLEGSMTIDADPGQMHQMLSQLLDNALKFHQPGKPSSVKINIQPAEGNQCRITIADDGIGVKLEHLSRIFDTFVRLHHGVEYSGTGIGLALVKKIVERHNGNITVESAPGEGSTFSIILPKQQS